MSLNRVYLIILILVSVMFSCTSSQDVVELYGYHDVEIDGEIYDKCIVSFTKHTVRFKNDEISKEIRIIEFRYIVLKAGGLLYFKDEKLYN